MEDLNEYKKKFEINHTFVCDIMECEGPLLSLYKDNENLYLYYWYGVNNFFNRWIISDISKTDLLDLIDGKVSLYTFFRETDFINIADIHHNNTALDTYVIPIKEMFFFSEIDNYLEKEDILNIEIIKNL